MSNPKKVRPKPQSAREAKRRRYYLLQIEEDVWYRCRRSNLTTLFLEGALQTPLVAAVDRLQEVRRALHEGINDVELLAKITPEDMEHLLELMRRVAVAVVIEPKMTHDEEAAKRDPDLLWVNDVDKINLIQVWRSVIKEAGVVTMSDDEADEFRTDESDHDAESVSDGESVRAETVVMDPHAGRAKETVVGIKFDYH